MGAKKWTVETKDKTHVSRDIQRIKKYCSTVRVIVATQIDKMRNFRQKKSHVMEIQVNGGDVAAKVAWCKDNLEKDVKIGEVFEKDEMIDTISITRGKGTVGVIKRFGVNRLPRKTHRGLRKVACIGAWHPSAVKWTVARTGNLGYYHRTQMNQKIYRVGAVLTEVLTTTLKPRWTQMSRTLPHWVDSLITVSLTRTSSSSRVVLWAQERDKSLSESLSCSHLPRGIPTRSIPSSLILRPRSVTVSTRPRPRRINSSVHSPPSKRPELDTDPSINYSGSLKTSFARLFALTG